MDENQFLDEVEAHGQFGSRDELERAVDEVMRTFGDRLSEGEAEDLAGFLPTRFGRLVLDTHHDPAAQFGLDEFVQHVARRESVDEETAREHVEAVAAAVTEAASHEEMREVTSQLPSEFNRLFDEYES